MHEPGTRAKIATAILVSIIILDSRTADAQTSGDIDGDGVPDNVDNCPTVPNPDQRNTDAIDVPPAGAVNAWRFEETPPNAPVVRDSIGTSDGTVIGTPLRVAGRFDQAMSFNGVNQFINLPASVS